MKKIRQTTSVIFLIVTILFLTYGMTFAQRLKSGPQDLSFFSKVDETDQPYAVYIPENFDESKNIL